MKNGRHNDGRNVRKLEYNYFMWCRSPEDTAIVIYSIYLIHSFNMYTKLFLSIWHMPDNECWGVKR